MGLHHQCPESGEIPGVIGVRPAGGKYQGDGGTADGRGRQRLASESAARMVTSGLTARGSRSSWDECCAFPQALHDDQVDAFSQLVARHLEPQLPTLIVWSSASGQARRHHPGAHRHPFAPRHIPLDFHPAPSDECGVPTAAETAAIDSVASILPIVARLARPAAGRVYRRKVRVCTTCDQRLDATAARRACEAANRAIDVREQKIWWITYDADGRRHSVSSHSEDRQVAEDLLTARERPEQPSVPTSAPPGPVTFDDAADDIVVDYQMNKKRSLRTLRIRIEKHLRPVFTHQPLLAITTPVVRTYITRRQAAGASNATINRDLITLKRMFTLAVQSGRLSAKPYIPLLKEQNVRRRFFEPEQFQRIKSQLPRYMQGIASFACVTGWRTPSEILPLSGGRSIFRRERFGSMRGRRRTARGASFRSPPRSARCSSSNSTSRSCCRRAAS